MKPKRNKMLSVRASEEEIARVKEFAAVLIKKNRYLTEADILRELIGLENTGLITPEMRRRLRPAQYPEPVIARITDNEHIPTEKINRSLPPGPITATSYEPKKGGRK